MISPRLALITALVAVGAAWLAVGRAILAPLPDSLPPIPVPPTESTPIRPADGHGSGAERHPLPPGAATTSSAGATSAEMVRQAARAAAQAPRAQSNAAAVAATDPRRDLLARLTIPRDSTGREVALPAAFAEVRDLPLNAVESALLARLREDFVRKAEGLTSDPAPDPSSPAYRRLWRNLVSQADQEFYGTFGHEAFNALSIRRRRESGG